MLALHIAQSLYPTKQRFLFLWWYVLSVFILFLRGPKQKHLLILDDEMNKISLLLIKQIVPFTLHFNHLLKLPGIVAVGLVLIGSIHYQHHTILNVREVSECFVKTFYKLGEFIGSSLTDMTLVYYQY